MNRGLNMLNKHSYDITEPRKSLYATTRICLLLLSLSNKYLIQFLNEQKNLALIKF